MSCSLSLTSSPERTSTLLTDAAADQTDRAPALASDLAGDPLQDPLPLLDLELDPDELDELDRLPLDLCPDAELSPEEEVPDCDCCGEGIWRICAWRESMPQVEGWEEDLTMEVSRHFSRPGRVLWRSRGWNNPCFTDWPASSTADDGLLQKSSAFLPLSKDGA